MSWGNPQNTGERILQAALMPAATAYGVGSYVRALGYATGALARTTLPVPVVSVGNLTVGGTGKTPITIDLARRMIDAGHKVAILSRGYKRKSTEPIVIVSAGTGAKASCEDAGDEPYLIARAVPDAVVVVGADRVASGELAINELGAQILLLDDGFQHVRLRRNIDLVLLDYEEDLDRARLLPAGRLREPASALGRASSIIVSKVPVGCDAARMGRIREVVQKYNRDADITFCQFKPKCDINLQATRVIAFSGIARPQAFIDSVSKLGATVADEISFSDHHWYAEKDLQQINASALQAKAQFIVTTEKDLVRIPAQSKLDLPIIAVKQETVWLNGLPQSMSELIGLPNSRAAAR
ncbi:MAG TPA: tetraacyldisaccharide 4'-kinase [Planktothrix sp.]|jgi:tetraacyldisaccharide 4'-kinase